MEAEVLITVSKTTPKPYKIYACNLCSYKTNRAYNVQRHLVKHYEKPPEELHHLCEYAGCSFATLRCDHLRRHIRGVHRVEDTLPNDTAQVAQLEEISTTKSTQKNVVLQKVNKKPELKEPKMVKARKSNKDAEMKTFECPKCNYCTSRAFNIQRHLAQHAEQPEKELLLHVCIISGCGFSTIRWDHLNRHIKRMHPDSDTAPTEERSNVWPVNSKIIINLAN